MVLQIATEVRAESISPQTCVRPRFSWAFLLAGAAFWVITATMVHLWLDQVAGLVLLAFAFPLIVVAIAQSRRQTDVSATVRLGGSRRMWQLLIALILIHASVAFAISKIWLPAIDTYTFQRDSCENLLKGIDPFGTTEADIYGPKSTFYSPGMVVNGRVQVGFQYPPLTLLWVLPGYFLGDVRYMYIVAVAVSALFLFAIYPTRRSLCIAVLLLLNPLTVFVEMKCWTEPLVLLTLCATLYAVVKKRWWVPIALGLFLASKQYNVVAVPFVACLIHPFRWRSYWKLMGSAIPVAGVTILPFALWNWHGLWHDLVLFHLAQPLRMDSLSFAVFSPFLLKVGPLITLAFVVWCLRAGMWNAAMFAAGYGSALLLFFSTSKQAFANYYFLIAQSLLLAVAALPWAFVEAGVAGEAANKISDSYESPATFSA